jgi:hypothetical protein
MSALQWFQLPFEEVLIDVGEEERIGFQLREPKYFGRRLTLAVEDAMSIIKVFDELLEPHELCELPELQE